MSLDAEGRLLTGYYGIWQDRRYPLSNPEPFRGELVLVHDTDEPLEHPWSAREVRGRAPAWYRNFAAVPAENVHGVVSITVRAAWNDCDLLIHDESPDRTRWDVEFFDGERAAASGALANDGISGDPRGRIAGWLPKSDVSGPISTVVDYDATGRISGSAQQRWEYGPLG
ncbi:hypothetical protein [Tersicoccus sp. Bi-70]|uniref:hypothetical protein n=1 Tax=Tersicoccus sp. Bi-70 TaxID=1897634 RepID=UPI00117D29D5|nr:hypothetical protein [Tersicoccus sp. Bi-70]